MILLEDVSRVYTDGEREVRALDGVNLHVPAGATLSLVGKSGSGKSTLLHLIGGLEWPSRGRVTVAGRALGALGDAALTAFRLRHIGFVFQFFHLLPALTVRENLLLPAELAALAPREARDRARTLLGEVGLADRADTFPDRLSGGEQQRVAVARALMLEPPVLLADEPTGNLDSENGERVLALIDRLARGRGTTVVLATHSPEVAQWAARRVELRDGRIRESASDAAAAADPPPPRGTAAGGSPGPGA